MLQNEFLEGIRRLKIKFGERPFDSESLRFIWRSVSGLTNQQWQSICDKQILTRRHTQAPLIYDFSQARDKLLAGLTQEQENKNENVIEKLLSTDGKGYPTGLRKFLDSYGCETISDAMMYVKLKGPFPVEGERDV